MVEQIFYTVLTPWVIGSICAGLMLAFWLIAFHWHRRQIESGSLREGEGGVLMDEACLAILGLLLAFTFAAAYSKYDNRNSKVADDANALRSLHFRCELLPEPWQKQIIPLAREAIEQRLLIVRPENVNPNGARAINEKACATESQMLAVVRRMNLDKDAASLCGPVADAVNAVAGTHQARIDAARDHVPLPVVALLLLVASISAFQLGRSQAFSGRLRKTTISLMLLVAAIILVTFDLESPLRGLIMTDQAPIIRLAANLGIAA
jgi:hypothetical protein